MPHRGKPFNARAALLSIFDSSSSRPASLSQRRAFHEYFVTHLPSASLSPDKQNTSTSPSAPPRTPSQHQASRDTTIVRIPIRGAKHHFGAGVSRGERPYNEDTHQAGTIAMPAFAKPQPVTFNRNSTTLVNAGAKSELGDPQVFYFGVFDGHGGSECSEFLRERLHGYVEEAALLFGLNSSLRDSAELEDDMEGGIMGAQDSEDLQKSLVSSWRETVGGYFKRFRPDYFPAVPKPGSSVSADPTTGKIDNSSIETVLTYAFLKADLDFTAAQASKHTSAEPSVAQRTSIDDPVLSDRPLNDNDLLFHPDRPASQNLRHRSTTARPSSTPDLKAPIGGRTRFKGGSTASVALISTPTPTPFWNPASPSTLIAAHVGDTRILLCRTSDGLAVPLTTNHHPDSPIEATRLRRYASTFTTDSFGESRMSGLANTRAFGDIGSKRLGVSAEPQLTTTHLHPAEYSFLVLVSDGVSGHLSDQEIVDIVKECPTPEQAARELVAFAVEVAESADNATGLVVRLGGWEKRLVGGRGAEGTKEMRMWKRDQAGDPRTRRQ